MASDAIGEIRGAPTLQPNNESIEEVKDTLVKEVRITTPKEKFIRDSYMLRERKPTRTVLNTLANDHILQLVHQRSYKIPRRYRGKGTVH